MIASIGLEHLCNTVNGGLCNSMLADMAPKTGKIIGELREYCDAGRGTQNDSSAIGQSNNAMCN